MIINSTSIRLQFQSSWQRLCLVWLSGSLVCSLLAIVPVQAQEDQLRLLPPINTVEPAAFFEDFLSEKNLSEKKILAASEEDQEDVDAEEKPTVEERLAKLEENYSGLGDDYGKLEKDYKGLKKKLKKLAATGHGESTMKVSGRIHVDLWTFPDSDTAINAFETGDPLLSPQDQFGFRRLRFGVKGDLWKTMLYKIEAEFAGGNKGEFRDAYFGWKDLPFLQRVLVGNQKRPYGLDHLNSSRFNVFLERPFAVEAFNQDARRLGVQSYNVSSDESWNWRYGVFNQRLIQDEGSYRSDHWQLEVAGRLANTFWYDESSGGRDYGHWAISGTSAYPDGTADGNRADNEARFRHRPEARSSHRWLNTGRIDGADNYQLLGLENVWNFGSLQLVGEYQNVWLQRDAGFGDDLNFNGGYFYAAYFLTGEHMPWKRSSGTLDRIKPFGNFFLTNPCCNCTQRGWGAWQIAYRWSHADFNDEDVFGGRGTSHTLGLNWYWNAYARMQFNAIYGEIDDAAINDGDYTDNPADAQSGNYTILGVRFMVDF